MKDQFPDLPERPQASSNWKYWDRKKSRTNVVSVFMQFNKPTNILDLQNLRLALAQMIACGGYACWRSTYEWEGQERVRYVVTGPSPTKLVINARDLPHLLDVINEIERSGNYRIVPGKQKPFFSDEED